MINLLIHDLTHKVCKADVSGDMIIVEPGHMRQVLELAEDGEYAAEDLEDVYEAEMKDLRLELSSTVMDYDTCLAEKAELKIGIEEAGNLIAEGNIAAAQTLIEELSK